MACRVSERQADECAARKRVDIWRTVALEVVEAKETVAARREFCGFDVEGREIEAAAADAAQPMMIEPVDVWPPSMMCSPG